MLRNPNNPENAVFAPRPDGGFTRFNADTGRPWNAGPGDQHGLFDRNGALHFGKLPSTMALDSATGLDPSSAGYRTPNSTSGFTPAPELPAKSGARMGEPGGADQNGGGAGGLKISRARAHAIWTFMQPKLSAQDLDKLVEMLKPMVDWSLPDEDEGADEDQPPAFEGQPLRGGSMRSSDPSHFPRRHRRRAQGFSERTSLYGERRTRAALWGARAANSLPEGSAATRPRRGESRRG
jgi:hypothetical protein